MKKHDIQLKAMKILLSNQEMNIGEIMSGGRHESLGQKAYIQNLNLKLEALEKEKKLAEEIHRRDTNSPEYKLGRVLLSPVRFIIRQIRKNGDRK